MEKNKDNKQVGGKQGKKQDEDVDVNHEEEEKVRKEGEVWMKEKEEGEGGRRSEDDLGEWGYSK